MEAACRASGNRTPAAGAPQLGRRRAASRSRERSQEPRRLSVSIVPQVRRRAASASRERSQEPQRLKAVSTPSRPLKKTVTLTPAKTSSVANQQKRAINTDKAGQKSLESVIRSISKSHPAGPKSYPVVSRPVVDAQARARARVHARPAQGEGRARFCFSYFTEGECPRGADCSYPHFKKK